MNNQELEQNKTTFVHKLTALGITILLLIFPAASFLAGFSMAFGCEMGGGDNVCFISYALPLFIMSGVLFVLVINIGRCLFLDKDTKKSWIVFMCSIVAEMFLFFYIKTK